MTDQMTVEDYMQYIKDTKSKNTVAQYRIGIEAFTKWFGKSTNEILEIRKQD